MAISDIYYRKPPPKGIFIDVLVNERYAGQCQAALVYVTEARWG
jgi:hypothetical protein